MAFAPVEWTKEEKSRFVEWLRTELSQTRGDRQELESTWENHLLQWRAKMTDGELDYPYPGASNLELPLTAMHADPVLADMVQSMSASNDYWTPTARRPDRVDVASALREGMTAIEKRFLKMRQVNLPAFLEDIVLGTAFYKNGWRSMRKRVRRNDASGETRALIQSISEPSIEHVPIQRLHFPAYAWSLDFDAPGGTPWISQEFRWSASELEAFRVGSEELPGFDKEAFDKVKTAFVVDEEPVKAVMREEDKFDPFTDEKVEVHEAWCRYDVKGDGHFEDFVVTMHPKEGEILRAIYLPNAHGKHPFHKINYLPGYGIYGIGLAEVDQWAQEASTQLLNANIDNVRLANTRMFSAPESARFTQDELVYPGKVWYLGPDESLGEVKLSEVYQSGFAQLQQLVQFSELRSGVNELRQGNISGLPSRTPATSLLSIMREGNKRFDMIHSGIREEHSVMGLRMLQNVAQRAKDDPFRWKTFFDNALGPQDSARVMSVLMTPDVEAIEEVFGISVTATSGSVNKEVEKQSFVGMMQLAQQIYGALIQTMMLHAQVPDPVVQAVAKASFVSGVDILRQLLERFDAQNVDEHMGQLEAIAQTFQAQSQPGGNAATGSLFQQTNLGILGGAGGIPPQGLDMQALASVLGMR